MQKTFLVKERNFKEISDGKGHLEYILLDEKGDTRVVTAIASKGRFKAFSGIKAIYKRETPLVKALTKASIDETVQIDFTKFNNKHFRSKLAVNSRNSSYKGAYSHYSGSTAVFDGADVFRLFGIAVTGFTLLMMMKFFL